MTGVIQPEERPRRPQCRVHKVSDHRPGAVVQCSVCERWRVCVRHRTGQGCRTEPVKWWDFKTRRLIRAHIASAGRPTNEGEEK